MALTFEALRKLTVRRCEEVFHLLYDWSPTDWMTAVAGEVGEAANLLKKARRGDVVTPSEIADELADAVTYLDLLAARLEIDLGSAVAAKFDIVSKRRGWAGPTLQPPTAESDLHVFEVDDGEHHRYAARGLLDALKLHSETMDDLQAPEIDSVKISRLRDEDHISIGHDHEDEVPEALLPRADGPRLTVRATCREWCDAAGRGLLGSSVW